MNSFGGPRTLLRGCGTQVLISLGLVLCVLYIDTVTRSMDLEVPAASICHQHYMGNFDIFSRLQQAAVQYRKLNDNLMMQQQLGH